MGSSVPHALAETQAQSILFLRQLQPVALILSQRLLQHLYGHTPVRSVPFLFFLRAQSSLSLSSFSSLPPSLPSFLPSSLSLFLQGPDSETSLQLTSLWPEHGHILYLAEVSCWMGQWPADGGSSEIKFGREEPVHPTGMFCSLLSPQ